MTDQRALRPGSVALRRSAAGAAAAIVAALATGIPTDLLNTPLFGREIPPTWWSYPVWILSSALMGVLVATYVAVETPPEVSNEAPQRFGVLGGLLGFFAIGCPVCNKLVLLALGSSGAIAYFEPIQPLLALVSTLLLLIAIRFRVKGLRACPIPQPAGRL
ncbi:MAG: hypothetical protein ACXWDC_03465 [Aeromicrobium sp.]